MLLLAGLTLLAFAVRLFHLDFQSLWRDEVDAVLFAGRSLDALLAAFTSVGDNGPLYFLTLHFWMGLAGSTEFAIRFPSAVAGVLAVLVTYQLGREVVGWRVGLIAAVLMAVSPYHIWYSQEAKMYALASLLAPLSLLALVRALSRGSRRSLAAWLGLMAAFLYVHLFALVVALVAAVWALLLGGRRRSIVILGACLIGLFLALPVLRWLIPAALTPAETGYGRFTLLQMVEILLRSFSMGLRPAAGTAPLLPTLLLLGLGAVPLVRRSQRTWWPPAQGVLLLILYLALPVLAVWLISQWRPVFTDRYLIIILPAFYLMVACGVVVAADLVGGALDRLRRPAGPPARTLRARRLAATRAGATAAAPVHAGDESARPRRLLMVVLVAVLVAALVVMAAPFVWAQAHNAYKADFRAATRYLVAQARPAEPVLFLMPYVQRSFAYYHPQPVATIEPPYTPGMMAAQVDEAMARLTAGQQRVWLFLSEPEFWDAQGLIAAWFEQHGVQSCRAVFTYVDVRCYDLAR